MDRGGLTHISDTLHMFFVSMELVVRAHFRADNTSLVKAGLKDHVLASIVEDDNVQFYWSLIGGKWLEEEAEELLRLLAEKWITLRGFSFASAFTELYKKQHKRTLEKSKGLRKNLIG